MACKSCGSDSGGTSELALPLTSEPSSTCSSCSQPTSSCSCEAFCEEDHVQKIVKKRYAFTLRVKSSFVWPALEQTVSLFTEGVDRLSPGSILWNPTAGYLHVVSFDFASQTVVAENQGEACNTYEGGENLPECTDFVVGPPPCGTGNTPISNIPYLAADFISIADGNCALASVTNILGLTINDTVAINGYEYRIGDILDSSTIELCNDGNGAPAGTVIQWDDDNDGIPNIPVIVTASENPCTRDPIVAGVLLACDGADVAKPLTGSIDGQIPVWNTVTGRFELKNLDIEFADCVSLTADLTADVAHVGSYAVSVTDTSAFVALGVVVIDSLLYTINTIDSGVLMHITPLATPIGVIVYPAGTPVCTAPDNPCVRGVEPEGVLLICKEGIAVPLAGSVLGQIPVFQDVATNKTKYEAQGGNVYAAGSTGVSGVISGGGTATLIGTNASISIVNPSAKRSLAVFVEMEATAIGNYDIAIVSFYTLTYDLKLSVNAGAFNSVALEKEQPPYLDLGGPGTLPWQNRVSACKIFTVAPGATLNLDARMDLNINGGAGTYDVVQMVSWINAIVTMM